MGKIKPDMTVISVQVPDCLAEFLDDDAEKHGRLRSDHLRKILLDYARHELLTGKFDEDEVKLYHKMKSGISEILAGRVY